MQEKSEEAYKETVGKTGITCLGGYREIDNSTQGQV